jgi:hypothetical protein
VEGEVCGERQCEDECNASTLGCLRNGSEDEQVVECGRGASDARRDSEGIEEVAEVFSLGLR